MPFLAQKHHPLPTKDLLSWTFDDLAYDWDKPIYIDALDPRHSISARQAKKAIRQLVAGFNALGVQQGDCVCIHSFNSLYYPLFFLGIIAAGGVFNGTNPAYTPAELSHAFKTTKAKYILVQPELLKPVEAACQQLGMPASKIIVFNPYGEPHGTDYREWADLFKHGEQDWVRFNDKSTSERRLAALAFSSGTTGLPKAAMVSHYNYTSYYTLMYETRPRPWAVLRCFAFPMFHATVPVAHTTPLKSGHPGYILPRFEPENWFRVHEKYGINEMSLLPPVVILAINSPLKEKYSLKATRYAAVGASPLDRAPQARMASLLGGSPLTQVWGMTEATCVITRFEYDESDETGSVGRPMVGLDMKIVDDDGRDITDYNVRGELCVRGPTVVKGYFENPEANARDWDSDGFFHTGDIGFCADGGLWYIVDRKKELIKVRAFQVAPAELEGALLSHPEIVDAAVIGIPDPNNEGSELPRAYLVLKPGSTAHPSKNDIHKYMREQLSAFKMLTGGIVIAESIPKNASGKILKRILREQAKREVGAKL